jgi:hypothetical protein
MRILLVLADDDLVAGRPRGSVHAIWCFILNLAFSASLKILSS